MKRTVLITIIIFGSISIWAQKPFSKLPKYSFGVFIAPHISSNFSKITKGASNPAVIFKPIFTYDIGINAIYHSNPRESYETGLNFTQQGFKELGDFKDNKNQPIEMGYFHDRISFFQLPFKYNYIVLKGKISLQISLGAAANLLATIKTTYDIGNNSLGGFTLRNRQIMNENFSLLGGFNCEYQINEKTTIRLAPYFQYFLKPISQETKNSYLYASGVQMAAFWRL